MTLAPIVLFVYNRLQHTHKTIEALQNNDLAKNSNLYIFSDAAKDNSEEKSVIAVRQFIRTINGFKTIKIIERQQNYGLAKSIIDGVTLIVNEYGKVIVIEDDIVTSPYFIQFMNDSLNFYQNEKEVMHISGYIYPINNYSLEDTFFIKPATCWGWSTWARAWKHFNNDADYYINTFNREMIKDFNLNNSYDYFSQIINNKSGITNSWAIFWHASIFMQNGLSLHPKNSFVVNIGHDGKGSNCIKNDNFDVHLIKNYPLSFTKQIKENLSARNKVESYLNSIKPSLLNRLLNKLKMTLEFKHALKK